MVNGIMKNGTVHHKRVGAAWVGVLLLLAVIGMVTLIVLQVMETGTYKPLWPQ